MMAGFGLLWILILAAAAYAVYLLARRAGAGPSSSWAPPRAKDAEEVLRQRYARGEIEREEYESRLRDLRK